MKNGFSFIWIFFFCVKSLDSNSAVSFRLKKGKDVPFGNYSLVPNTTLSKMGKHFCFSECMKNEFCSFVVYKNNVCSLHTEYALSRLTIHTNLNVVFEKKFIIDHCSSSPCKNGATCVNRLRDYLCLCDEGYFGSNCEKIISDHNCTSGHYRLNESEPCTPCMNGFTTYNNYPFNCYKDMNNSVNFNIAKQQCQNLNSFLWRPKTLTERRLFDDGWADSKIEYVGQPFLWPDGSKVYGIGTDEPNNSGGTECSLKENVLDILDNYLNDRSENEQLITICQQIS